MAPWKSIAISTSCPTAFRSSANFRRRTRLAGRLDVAGRTALGGARFERGEPELDDVACIFSGVLGVSVDADSIAGGSAEQFVDRHAERLALDVPERLVDAAERAGQHRTAAIKGVAVDRLPMMDHGARIFPDQIRLDFLDGGLRT